MPSPIALNRLLGVSCNLTAGVAISVLSALLAGCAGFPEPAPALTTAKPSPTSTPTPVKPSAAEVAAAAKQKNIDGAETGYRAVIAKTNEVEKAGMKGWEQIIPLLGSSELTASSKNYYEQTSEQGLRQTGDRKVATIALADYLSDTTGAHHEQVRFEVCLDTSASDLVDPAGKSMLQEDFPRRLIIDVLMQRQTDGRWTMNEEKTSARTC